jgi:hypothetical protein
MSRKFVEIVRFTSMIVIPLLVPIFAVLAIRMLVKAKQFALSKWRIGLGLASIALTLLCWITIILLPTLERLGVSTNFFKVSWVDILMLLALLSMLLSVALKGKSRIYALLASSLIFCAWTISIIH